MRAVERVEIQSVGSEGIARAFDGDKVLGSVLSLRSIGLNSRNTRADCHCIRCAVSVILRVEVNIFGIERGIIIDFNSCLAGVGVVSKDARITDYVQARVEDITFALGIVGRGQVDIFARRDIFADVEIGTRYADFARAVSLDVVITDAYTRCR